MSKPKLIIPQQSYQKIMQYVKGCDIEITGLADVSYDPERDALIVGTVFPLIKQVAAGTEVELDDDDYDDFTLALSDLGIVQQPRLWWHSHVDMQAFFSPTDMDTIKSQKNETFNVALVCNKRKEMAAILQVNKPVRAQVPLEIEIEDGTDPTEEILQEILDKVEERKYVAPAYTYPKYEAPKKREKKEETYSPKTKVWHDGHLVSDCELSTCRTCLDYYTEFYGK